MSLVDGELKFREVRQHFQDHTARQVAELEFEPHSIFFFFPPFWPHSWHVDIAGPGTQLVPQQRPQRQR